jgi:uncharacterized protein YuzE
MSQVLTVKLNDNIFIAIQQQAEIIGISPELLSANLLEQHFKQTLDEAEREAKRERFENHFGEIGVSYQMDVSNESIDADLAREYANNHEEV